MKGIYLFGAAATAAGLLFVGVASSVAAGSAGGAAKGSAGGPAKGTCKVTLTDQIPLGDTSATPGSESGTQFGSVQCHKLLGGGVQADDFTLMSNGNVQGKYKQYFEQGSISGTYMLSPNGAAPPSQATFTSETYTGKSKIAKGTGALKGAKGTATITCSTADGVHFSCVDKVKLAHT